MNSVIMAFQNVEHEHETKKLRSLVSENFVVTYNGNEESVYLIQHFQLPCNPETYGLVFCILIVDFLFSDISDRRKKRKIMPGQIYVNDDATVPSPIMNDCDISAKENNPSVMTVDSQVNRRYFLFQIECTVTS